MATIVVKTQKELDKIPIEFKVFTYIEIRSDKDVLIEVTKTYKNSQVRAYGSSQVRAYGSSQVTAYGSSQVRACDSSQVRACDSSQVRACDSSQVTACDSSQVRACGSSQVRACGSSQVTACDSSQVTACDSSQVTACDSSQVTAYGSSQVTACDSSQVTACGNSMVAILSATVILHKIKQYAVITLDGIKIKLPKKDRTATVIKRKLVEHTIDSFVDIFALKIENNCVVLFKTVCKETGCDFRTKTIKYEGIVKCHDFDPSNDRECGGGLHLCATPQGAIGFATGPYKLLKCKVKLKDIVVYGKSIEKVRCRQVQVLGEFE